MIFNVTESKNQRFNRCMKKEELQLELDKLSKKIKGLEKPFLASHKKFALKSSILGQINVAEDSEVEAEFGGVVGYIKKLTNLLRLDLGKRALIKEHVFAVIENTPQKSFWVRNFFAFNKKLISGVMVASLFFGMFSFVSVDTSVVMAQTFTVLESFEGEVDLLRNGKEVEIVSGMNLFEGDDVLTGKNGSAVIKYFDNSLTRLSPNTEVSINKLSKDRGRVTTYVEVVLETGMVWSRVMNSVGGDSAFVLKAKDVETRAKKAAFNTRLKDDKLEVEVFNSSVDVKKGEDTEKVLRGQKVVVNGKFEFVALANNGKDDAWVKGNLESDKEYLIAVEERLLDAKIESMGSDVSIGQSFREDVAVFLTFNDIDKQKIELDIAEKNLVAAEIKLSDPKLSDEERVEVEAALSDFADKSKKFNQTIKEVGYSDQKYSEELKGFLDNKISTHQKELNGIMPDSPLYRIKTLIDDVSLVGATDDTDLLTKKLDQVSNKLAVAEDAASLGQTEVAMAVMNDSKVELGNVVEMMGEIEQSAPNSVTGLTPKVDEVQKYLTAVAGTPVVVTPNPQTEPVVTSSFNPENIVKDVEGGETVETINGLLQDSDVQKIEYGIYIKGEKMLPSGFVR